MKVVTDFIRLQGSFLFLAWQRWQRHSQPQLTATMKAAGSMMLHPAAATWGFPGSSALPSMGPRPLCPVTILAPLRDVQVAGRNDGHSKRGMSDRQRRRQKSRGTDSSGVPWQQPNGAAWWEDEQQAGQSTAGMQTHRQQYTASSSSNSSSMYERRWRQERERSDDDEGQGWWEKPEEASLQAYAPRQLADWQVRRLEEAYSAGRRKIKVQSLAQELGLDRTEVLHWIKEFTLKPESERLAIITERKASLAAQQAASASEPQQPSAQPGWLGDPQDAARRAAAAAQAHLPQHPQGLQGFIPFYTRKELGLADFKHRRLSADVVRTLESIYSRTPFPPDDVIKGMWDLHRVNRETVLGWLQARRQEDGITSSEQKRPSSKDNLSDMSPAKLREAMGAVAFDANNLLVQLAPQAAAGQENPEAPQAEQPVQVVAVSKRQLAQLKSSLPSPRKHKGKKRAEAMGVATDGSALQVGSVQYVPQEVSSDKADRWRAVWRLKRATKPTRTLPLLLDRT